MRAARTMDGIECRPEKVDAGEPEDVLWHMQAAGGEQLLADIWPTAAVVTDAIAAAATDETDAARWTALTDNASVLFAPGPPSAWSAETWLFLLGPDRLAKRVPSTANNDSVPRCAALVCNGTSLAHIAHVLVLVSAYGRPLAGVDVQPVLAAAAEPHCFAKGNGTGNGKGMGKGKQRAKSTKAQTKTQQALSPTFPQAEDTIDFALCLDMLWTAPPDAMAAAAAALATTATADDTEVVAGAPAGTSGVENELHLENCTGAAAAHELHAFLAARGCNGATGIPCRVHLHITMVRDELVRLVRLRVQRALGAAVDAAGKRQCSAKDGSAKDGSSTKDGRVIVEKRVDGSKRNGGRARGTAGAAHRPVDGHVARVGSGQAEPDVAHATHGVHAADARGRLAGCCGGACGAGHAAVAAA